MLTQNKIGGLGMSTIFSLNRVLLFKWMWCFYLAHHVLWVKVVKAMYGPNASIDRFTFEQKHGLVEYY